MQDEQGRGVPGIEVWLLWSGGADRAVTGLKPAQGAGYVDFEAKTGLIYQVSMGELELPLVSNLRIATCPGEPDFPGGWRIVVIHHMAQASAD